MNCYILPNLCQQFSVNTFNGFLVYLTDIIYVNNFMTNNVCQCKLYRVVSYKFVLNLTQQH